MSTLNDILRNRKINPDIFHLRNHSLRSLSRIKTGGWASHFFLVNTVKELQEVVFFAKQNEMDFYIIGNGTNVILSDSSFKGVVIKLGDGFKFITINDEKYSVRVGSGTSLMKLGYTLARKGYSGFSYMTVIPGTIGGAVKMNAGIPQKGEIKNHFLTSNVFDTQTLKIVKYDAINMEFAHRSSAIKNSEKIILDTVFKLPEINTSLKKKVVEEIYDLRNKRRKKQPQNVYTFGSTFKKPRNGKPAGWYLERVGMKGMREGGAMVAFEHANWILNQGNATANDFKALIDIGKRRVFEEFGIHLEREVIYLPEDFKKEGYEGDKAI